MHVQLEGIWKSFGSNLVLKDVNFSVDAGQICALIGENGAGKSTLMNILGGVLPADRGVIVIDGEKRHFRVPADSLDAGIAFIHQELNLINDLAIYENMFIGRELKKRFRALDADRMIEATQAVFDRMQIELDPRMMVRDLDASYKQIVEISRALMMDASTIIMDEPTTALTDSEITRIFDLMRSLAAQGVGIVFISHKLKEVVTVCSHYTVLRDGKVVASGDVAGVTTDKLAQDMVGHEVRTTALQRKRSYGPDLLRVEKVSDNLRFHDISFSVRGGEIFGVTGLLGDGRSELFQAIFGAGSKFTGTVFLNGKTRSIHNTIQAVDAGLGYVPRNRKENAIIQDMNILENGSLVTLKRLARRGVIDRKQQHADFDRQVRELRIKLERKIDPITSLSGGNQQKVVLAKWLSAGSQVLVLDNPTQGVDVGAKEEIYDIILKLADEGVAIVVLSSEAQEVIRVCDRTIVLYHGRIMGELSGTSMTEQQIMRLATGHEAERA